MATQQSDVAVTYANQVSNLVTQLRQIRKEVAEIVALNTAVPLGNLWNALNTAVLAADGAIGTADTPGTPVNAHYVDPRLYPAINRVMKNTDLTNALQVLVDFAAFCAGTSLATNGARPAQMDAVSM